MTKQQYKICKFILKHPKLTRINEEFNLDYQQLQDKLGTHSLYFSDYKFDENTSVCLSDTIIEEYEMYHRNKVSLRFSMAVGTIGAITGITALLLDIIPMLTQLLKQ